MIRANSPYTLNIDFTSPLSSIVADDITINIYVYLGNKTTPPIDASYVVNKKRYSEDSVSIDISGFLRDDLNVYTNNFTTWVKTAVIYNTGDILDDGVEQLENTQLASLGYSKALDGANYTDVNNNMLAVNNERYCYRGSDINLSLLKEDTAPLYNNILVQSFPDGQLNTSITELTSLLAVDKIQNLSFTDTSVTDRYIEVSYGANKIYYDILNTDEYENKKLTFINKYGVKDEIQFKKLHKTKQDKTKEEYKNLNNQANSGYHSYRSINANSRTSFTLETPYILEENNDLISDLLLSNYVWIDGNVPVNISVSNISYKTKLEDVLVSYTIDCKYSFDDINNIF